MADREQHAYKAKLAEQAERYEEMVDSMKKMVEANPELSIEERNLLSVGYKNVIGTRRASWRVINAIEGKASSDPDRLEVVRKYRQKIEKELNEICDDILDLLTNKLIPSDPDCKNVEAQVFYYKMKGDYCRYRAEFQQDGEARKACANDSLSAYSRATELAQKEDDGLATTHPIRLGLALNFSVFYYEILNESKEAISLAKSAFNDAVKSLTDLADDSYKDSTLILQLLRDNLTLWTSEEDVEKPEPVEDVEDQ